MRLKIELTTIDVKNLVLGEIERRLGDIPLNADGVKIETKSAMNYKSEWEKAEYRVTYEANVDSK